MRMELPGQGRMENLDGRHGDLERGVRGSPDVGISGFSRLPRLGSHGEFGWPAWRIGARLVYSQAEASK